MPNTVDGSLQVTASESQPTLNTLPSELRRLIVSHLTPAPGYYQTGCKISLQSANLAHSSLREWVPEYMFRDMVLNHVLVGMSSQLERFAVDPLNAKLLKFVKHIVVQVPPALRWEINRNDGAFGHRLEEITTQRLLSRMRVTRMEDMTDEQLQFCKNYYRAMVKPFTDNRNWNQLQRTAYSSWHSIFNRFINLEAISVGSCDIVDQPSPTNTHTFVSQHGKDINQAPTPAFVEDATVNMAWASSIVIKSAPARVRRLQLSMANMDNFNSFATINRLQNITSRRPFNLRTKMITRLSLTLRGITGTHGNRDWQGDTGSAGSVRLWKTMLNSLEELRHLELIEKQECSNILRFSSLELSDTKASIIDWILPDLVHKQLDTLCLDGFVLDTALFQSTLSGNWPSLQHIVLHQTALMLRVDENIKSRVFCVEHLQGRSWVEACRGLIGKHRGLHIKLNKIASTIDNTTNMPLDPKYVKQVGEIQGVELVPRNPKDFWPCDYNDIGYAASSLLDNTTQDEETNHNA